MKKLEYFIMVFFCLIALPNLAQYHAYTFSYQRFVKGGLEMPYSFGIEYDLLLSPDSVYVYSVGLEYAFVHDKNLNDLTVHYVGFENLQYDEAFYLKQNIDLNEIKLEYKNEFQSILGKKCQLVVGKKGKYRIEMWVADELGLKTTIYPFYFQALYSQNPKGFNNFLKNIPGLILAYKNYYKNELVYQAEAIGEKKMTELPDFSKYRTAETPLSDFKPTASIRNIVHQNLKGEQIPDFSIDLISGEHFNSNEWTEHVKVYDFWGLWCGGCKLEIPNLNKIYDLFEGEKVRFIAFADDDVAPLIHYQKIKPFYFDIAAHADWVAHRFGATPFPMLYVVSKDNKVIYQKEQPLVEMWLKEDYDTHEQKLIETIRAALEEK